MQIARQLFRLAVLGAINHQITYIVVASSLFADFREWSKRVNQKLGQLVSCHLCFSTWVGFLLALLFRPRFIDVNSSGLPLRRPTKRRQIAAFFADSFAIALASRFFLEVLAILSNRAAVVQRQRELLEKQEHLFESEVNPTPAQATQR
jgi:hypothetical protein